jgi:hypothetical protein
MNFSIDRFVRSTPIPALRDYFERRGIELGDDPEWDEDEKAVAKTLIERVKGLDDVRRGALLAEWERVHELTDEIGQNALLGAATDRKALIATFSSMESVYERALWVCLNDNAAFERAEDNKYVDYGRQGRLWDGFATVKSADVRRNKDAKDAFVAALRDHFAPRDGSGRNIKVEVFDRARRESDGFVELVQIIVYLEGLPVSSLEFEDGDLSRRLQRPAIEVAFTYAPESGEMDVVAKGGRDERRALAKLFLQHLLVTDLEPEQIPLRIYNLNSLRDPRAFPTDPDDGIRNVTVRRLRLRPYAGSGGRVIIEVDARSDESIYDVADDWFGSRNPLRNGFLVNQARMSIEFYRARGGRKSKVITFDLSYPNGCSLKDQTEYERRISEKYLVQWGLVENA